MTCAEKTAWLQAVKTAGSAIASAGTAMAALKSAAAAAELERTILLREQLAVEIGRLVAAMDSAEEKKKAYLEWLRKDAARIVEGREDAERSAAIDSIASMRGHSEVTADSEVVQAVARMREAAAAKDMKAFRKAYDEAVAAADKAWKPQTQQERDTASSMAAINARHTVRELDVKGTNPNYGKGNANYGTNCQRCVPAFEMRLRGYDVEALPSDGNHDGVRYFPDKNTSDMIQCGGRGKFKKDVEKRMREWGDGARGLVRMHWIRTRNAAHFFMAINEGGTIRYVDPQDPSRNAESHFDRAAMKGNWIMRIDNARIGLVAEAAKAHS